MERANHNEITNTENGCYTLELESTFDAVSEAIKLVNDFLDVYMKHMCINLWCFEEMLVNAVEHGNRFDPAKKVNVEVKAVCNYVMFTITDEGEGFDWRSYIVQERCLLANKERGRGIVMSNMLSSHLTYNDKGNQVVILYNLKECNN